MKILLVQTSFLGDTILSTPLIAAIKELHPEAELWMMTTPAGRQLVERDPLLAGVISFDKRGSENGFIGMLRCAGKLREMGFAKVYSLHRSLRTSVVLWLARIPERIGFKEARLSLLYHKRERRPKGVHEVQRNLAILNGDGEHLSSPEDLRLFAPAAGEVREEVQSFLRASEGGYVVLVPGSVWRTKRWWSQGYRSVAEHFIKLGKRVVLLGAPSEAMIGEEVARELDVANFVGSTSLAEMLLLIKQSQLVICNDSMALHCASSFKIPTVAVFCSTSPSFGFGPWLNRAKVVEKQGLSCKPCGRHGRQRCPTGTEDCMRGVSAEEVIAASQELGER